MFAESKERANGHRFEYERESIQGWIKGGMSHCMNGTTDM